MGAIAAFIAAYAMRKALEPPRKPRPAWHYLAFAAEAALIARFFF